MKFLLSASRIVTDAVSMCLCTSHSMFTGPACGSAPERICSASASGSRFLAVRYSCPFELFTCIIVRRRRAGNRRRHRHGVRLPARIFAEKTSRYRAASIQALPFCMNIGIAAHSADIILRDDRADPATAGCGRYSLLRILTARQMYMFAVALGVASLYYVNHGFPFPEEMHIMVGVQVRCYAFSSSRSCFSESGAPRPVFSFSCLYRSCGATQPHPSLLRHSLSVRLVSYSNLCVLCCFVSHNLPGVLASYVLLPSIHSCQLVASGPGTVTISPLYAQIRQSFRGGGNFASLTVTLYNGTTLLGADIPCCISQSTDTGSNQRTPLEVILESSAAPNSEISSRLSPLGGSLEIHNGLHTLPTPPFSYTKLIPDNVYPMTSMAIGHLDGKGDFPINLIVSHSLGLGRLPSAVDMFLTRRYTFFRLH